MVVYENYSAIIVRISKSQFIKFDLKLHLKSTYKIQKFDYTKQGEKPKSVWIKTGIKNIFGKYLLLTNTLSSGILMCFGDIIQQELENFKNENTKKAYDWRRSKNMAVVGLAVGPLSHFFYQILDKYIPGTNMPSIAKKILLDQTIASPLFIVTFFIGLNYLNNLNLEASKKELSEKFWMIYAVDCCLWIPFQFFNFCCLSPAYRVLYVNVITMCYNVFLSFAKHN